MASSTARSAVLPKLRHEASSSSATTTPTQPSQRGKTPVLRTTSDVAPMRTTGRRPRAASLVSITRRVSYHERRGSTFPNDASRRHGDPARPLCRAKCRRRRTATRGASVGEQDFRERNRDRIEELRQEFQQRQEAVEAAMEDMRQHIDRQAEEHPLARVSETASLGLLIADAIRQSGREIALAIRETASRS